MSPWKVLVPKSYASLCLGESCVSVHNEIAIQFLDLLRRYLIYTQPRVGKIIQTSSITGIHELVHAIKHTRAKPSKKDIVIAKSYYSIDWSP